MVQIALGALVFAAAASAIQVGPVATSYIYRSDNGGPGSLIQLDSHGYQPQVFPGPLPIAYPLKAIDAYAIGPVPLPYIAGKPIVTLDKEEGNEDEERDDEEEGEEDEEGDYFASDADDLHHDSSFKNGRGSEYGGEFHKSHGIEGSKGFNSKEHQAKGKSGHYGKKHNERNFAEGKSEKGVNYDESDAHGKHHANGGSYDGEDNGHKKHFSKGEDITGYHKVFNKDEFKKDHDFYDVQDKSGYFTKYGYEKGSHGSAKGGHKEGGHHNSKIAKGESINTGGFSKGHNDDADSSNSAEEGEDSHFEKGADYGKKGGSAHEKKYASVDNDEEY